MGHDQAEPQVRTLGGVARHVKCLRPIIVEGIVDGPFQPTHETVSSIPHVNFLFSGVEPEATAIKGIQSLRLYILIRQGVDALSEIFIGGVLQTVDHLRASAFQHGTLPFDDLIQDSRLKRAPPHFGTVVLPRSGSPASPASHPLRQIRPVSQGGNHQGQPHHGGNQQAGDNVLRRNNVDDPQRGRRQTSD